MNHNENEFASLQQSLSSVESAKKFLVELPYDKTNLLVNHLYHDFKEKNISFDLIYKEVSILLSALPSSTLFVINDPDTQKTQRIVTLLLEKLTEDLKKDNIQEALKIIELIKTSEIVKNLSYRDYKLHNLYVDLEDYFCTIRLLGTGAFAKVYLGYHKETAQKVAIKKIDLERARDKNMLKRVETEALLLQSLDHPNIVKLFKQHHQTTEYTTSLFLILEFCEGGTLQQHLSKHKFLPENDVRSIISQIATACNHLHTKQIIHRDIKPSNLLLTNGTNGICVVKVSDFNVARVLAEGQLATTFAGTPQYMAPEILRSPNHTHKADLFSIGAITYELLFGTPLAPAFSSDPLLDWTRPVSESAKDIIVKLLRSNPDERMDWEQFFCHPFIVGENGCGCANCPWQVQVSQLRGQIELRDSQIEWLKKELTEKEELERNVRELKEKIVEVERLNRELDVKYLRANESLQAMILFKTS